jgi:hypothetical protein
VLNMWVSLCLIGSRHRIFLTRKGMRQGDPLFSVLFNIVVDMLAIFNNRANEANQIKGVIPNLVDGGLSILQYAKHKLLLCAFEELLCLKINFHKSGLFLGKQKNVKNNTHKFLGVNRVRYLLGIWVFLCIVDS